MLNFEQDSDEDDVGAGGGSAAPGNATDRSAEGSLTGNTPRSPDSVGDPAGDATLLEPGPHAASTEVEEGTAQESGDVQPQTAATTGAPAAVAPQPAAAACDTVTVVTPRMDDSPANALVLSSV